jgi:F0F1-type ATP synthase assembly protein I
VIARRKRWRLIKTVAAALVGAAIGWLLFTMIGSGLARP